MYDLDVWNMVQRKERAILHSQRRAERRRQVTEAIARMTQPNHSRSGLLRRAWHIATARSQRPRERGKALPRGAGHGQADQEAWTAPEQVLGPPRP